MYFDPQSGRVRQARWIASPNYNHRPHPGFVNALVIHAISLPPDCFGNNFVEAFFCNTLDCTQHPYFESITDLKVSSHFYIRRNGELVQFVATTDRAWHAGQSELQGLDTVNDFSIGIELEGCDEQDFCDTQYTTLTTLSLCLMQAYPAITKHRIVGHSEIAPGRKTDPGPCFDWQRYRGKL